MIKALKTIAVLLTALLTQQSAQAVLMLDFSQSGPDVKITATGTVDVAGLTYLGNFMSPLTSDIYSNVGDQAFVRSISAGDDIYLMPFVHPLFSNSFGITNGVTAGDHFGIFSDDFFNELYLFMPNGFTSGGINGSLTIPNTTLASLGVNTLGVTAWGGSPNQAISITTSATPVPEPATYLALTGFTGLALLVWRRQKNKAKATEQATA